MFNFLRTNRWTVAAIVSVLLCVVGSLLYSRHIIRESDREFAKTEEQVQRWETRQQTSPDTEQTTSDTVPPDSVHNVPAETPTPEETEREKTEEGDVAPTNKSVQTSTNPLFADGVPKHLQCPEEWIGTYLS